MSHRRVLVGAVLLLALAVAAVFGAGATAPDGAAGARAADGVALTVQHNGTVIKQYTLADLQALTVYDGFAGFKNSTGNVTGPDAVTGVRIADVLQDALGGTGMTAEQSVDSIALDNYPQTLKYGQVTAANAANWVMFNTVTGGGTQLTDADIAGQLSCILAWSRGGAALPADEGPLRLYVADSVNESVVMRGSDSEFQVVRLNVRDEVLPSWELKLVGLKANGKAPVDLIDTQSYQSCAAPSCHRAAWTGPSGQSWTGVALYMLLGQVDGGKDMTYSAALARKGYRIRFYSADGRTFTMSSKATVRRNSIVVADSAGGALTAKYYPLRLVGPEKWIPASKRLGRIVKIKMLPW